MKQKMFFLSDAFPYGRGEKTFIEPELEALSQEYDITLITHANVADMADTGNKSAVDQKISVLHFDRHISIWQKICWGICFFLDKEGRQEFVNICQDGICIYQRLYQAIGFYILARKELQNVRKANLLSSEEEIICYSYWSVYFCYAFLRLKKEYPKLKVITRMHGMDLYNERMKGMRQPFKTIMDKKLDGVIFAADYAKDYYLNQFAHNKNDKKYVVCKLGVPQANIKPHDAGKFCLLSCSNAIPLKRIELIIQALFLLRDEQIYWVHIGDGESFEKLKAYAREKLEDKSNITYEFKGYLHSRQIQTIYEDEKIDGFITTSSTEGGCPVSVQEAMSYRIPIIGTSVGGITEMINGNGFLLPANPTPEVIAEIIKKLYYLDTETRKQMSQSSYQIWFRDYNIQNNLKKLITAIHYLKG